MANENKSSGFYKNRLTSFGYACRGLQALLKYEINSRVHLVITLLVIAAGFYFHVSSIEWIILILCICLVFGAELFNTAIEKTIDFISMEKNPKAGAIKDLSAAAVLVMAAGSLITGMLIFMPYIFKALSN